MVGAAGGTAGEESVSTFGRLVARIFEVLSSIEPGINGPHSGSDHRHCSSKDSHYDRRQRVARAHREAYPDPDDSNHGSRHRRPKAEKQK